MSNIAILGHGDSGIPGLGWGQDFTPPIIIADFASGVLKVFIDDADFYDLRFTAE